MPLTDILILVGMFFFMALGFRDGVLKKIFAVIGLLTGLICATKFMVPVSEVLGKYLGFSKESLNVLSFFLLFALIVILENLMYRWFGETSSESMRIWSRMFGAVVGAAQGTVAISLVLLMLSIFDLPSEESRKESDLYSPFIKIAPKVFDISTSWIPESRKFFDELKDQFESLSIPK